MDRAAVAMAFELGDNVLVVCRPYVKRRSKRCWPGGVLASCPGLCVKPSANIRRPTTSRFGQGRALRVSAQSSGETLISALLGKLKKDISFALRRGTIAKVTTAFDAGQRAAEDELALNVAAGWDR
jgi:hypothetical protein